MTERNQRSLVIGHWSDARGQNVEILNPTSASPRLRVSPILLRPLLCAFVSLCSALCALPSHASEIFSGRLYTVPEKIYVNQAFEIHFELEVSSGNEVEDLRISDFPNNPDLITVGRLETTSRNRITRDAKAIDVLTFTAAARSHQPIEHTFNPSLQCMLVERRTTGFFSHWQSYPAQRQLEPFALRILPLPAEGRPASFSGAIGAFRLTGRLSQTNIQPGDIITLTLELAGQGWLGQAAMPAPAASPLFKYYPAKETLREPLRVTTEQVIIPNATNATEIASVRFSFFNPATGHYEESVAGPFRLTLSREATPKAEEVRVISTIRTDTADTASGAPTLKQTGMTLRQAAPLIAVCLAGALGGFLFFMLYGRHSGLAFLAVGLTLTLGGGIGYTLGNQATDATCTLAHRVEVRFAPSATSAALFSLNPGTPVVPLETAGTWTRIDAAGQRGWIPGGALDGVPSSPKVKK